MNIPETESYTAGLTPRAAAKWARIRQTLEMNSMVLTDSGALARKPSAGGDLWTLRYYETVGRRRIRRTMYIGRDIELIQLVRAWLADVRSPAKLRQEIAVAAKLADLARIAVERLGGGGSKSRTPPVIMNGRVGVCKHPAGGKSGTTAGRTRRPGW